MHPRSVILAATLALATLAVPDLRAQAADTTKKDSAATAPAPEPATPVKLSGYLTASYTYSNNPNGNTIGGRLYDNKNDQFMFNAAKVVVSKAAATDKLDAGFEIDALFGQNGSTFQASGLGLGTLGDISHAFVTLNLPMSKDGYVQFKAGKSATLMGVEVIEDPVNPNLSIGNQFIFVENTTNTGVGADLHFNPKVEADVRVINGWDLLTDNNKKKSFMGRVVFTPDDKTTIIPLGYYGPEQPLSVDPTSANKRYGGEVVFIRKLVGSVVLQGQFDAGKEEKAAPSGGDAKWWAGGLWLTADLSPKVGLALRGDYVDDKQGARSLAFFGVSPAADVEHKFGSGTATLNIKTWPNTLIRPEIRYDKSNQTVFGGQKDQFTLALGVTYIYP
ncbi:MAG TPA: outer membrane beta-barrel protein [Gemmatimonadales bacterium]|nr:outer membrane beta-barrel protein [Gemmatimonadales bacterium]